MSRSFLSRLRRRLAEEQGAALIVTLGISLGLGIAGASMIEFTTSNSRAATRAGADRAAWALAEAGLNNALSVLANSANPTDPAPLATPATTTYTTGTAVWSGTYDRANALWTLTSTGIAHNPAAQGALRRTMSTRVRVTPVLTQPLPNDAWDYLYTTKAGAGTNCDIVLNSGVAMSSPMFVSGNLCIASGASVVAGPPATPTKLVVKKGINNISATSTVGTAAAPISEVHVGYGCKYASQPWHPDALNPFCSDVDHVYAAAGKLDQAIPAITPPTPDWGTWYRYGAPGPFEPCTAQSGTPPVFENEAVGATANNSVPTVFNLTGPVSYSCRVGPAGQPLGELSWDSATRTLRVSGTIYIDGSVVADNPGVIVYTGRGTIYLSGTFTVAKDTKLCAKAGGADCDFDGWHPEQADASILTVVSSGPYLGVSTTIGVSASFEGLLFANIANLNAISLSSSAQAKGGMVAYSISFASSSKTYPFPAIDASPTGTPGATFSFPHLNPPQDFSN